jgi:CBS domain-containing protein
MTWRLEILPRWHRSTRIFPGSRPIEARPATGSGRLEAIVANLRRGAVREMKVREGMSKVVLSVGPGHTLRQAATLMASRHVGAAIVVDPEGEGPGILTERDILVSVAAGQDPDGERVAEHLTADVVSCDPDWSLEEAATAMVRGGFRHLLVVDGGEITGIVSVRDIVRCWTDDGAICDVPASASAAR